MSYTPAVHRCSTKRRNAMVRSVVEAIHCGSSYNVYEDIQWISVVKARQLHRGALVYRRPVTALGKGAPAAASERTPWPYKHVRRLASAAVEDTSAAGTHSIVGGATNVQYRHTNTVYVLYI
jgi:hypothetical protein